MQSRPTILAVDDNPSNLVTLEAVLERDFDVRGARSGREAIAMLQAHPDVDVIVMDLQMPGMDGYESASAIKKLPHCADIPIVFLTAVYNEDPHVKRGYAVGAVDYFTKPFDPDLLRLKIGIYASFRQRTKERERQLRATKELLQVERRLIEMLRSLPAGVIIVDSNGRIREVSEDVFLILGLRDRVDRDRLAAVLGWWDSAGDMIAQRAALLAAALRGESRTDDLAIAAKDGAPRSFHVCGSPIRGTDGAVAGAVLVMHDVSDPVRGTAELEDRITKLVAVHP